MAARSRLDAIARFFRDLGMLTGGTIAGHLLLFALTPVLTRLVSPTDMGVFGIFTAFVAVLSVIISLGYEMGVLGAGRREALRLISGVLALSAFGAAAGAVVLCGLSLWARDTSYPLWLAPVVAATTFFANGLSVFQYWYLRENKLRQVAISAFGVTGLRGLANLGGAVLLGNALGLALGDLVGRFVSILLLDKGRLFRRSVRELFRHARECGKLLLDNRRFAFYQMPGSVLDTATFWVSTPLVALLYGPETAGQFALAQRLISAPSSLVGKALADVYQKRALDMRGDHGALARLTLAILGVVVAIVLPIWLVLQLYAPELFALVFGKGWTPSSHISQILIPLSGMHMAGTILTRLLLVKDTLNAKFIVSLLLFGSLLAVFGAGALLRLPVFALLQLLVSVSLVEYVVCFYVVMYRIR